jgi:hypothetical protein
MPCLSNCKGNGKCVDGACECDAGRGSVDCGCAEDEERDSDWDCVEVVACQTLGCECVKADGEYYDKDQTACDQCKNYE